MHNASVGDCRGFSWFLDASSAHIVSPLAKVTCLAPNMDLCNVIWNLVIAFDVCQRHALPHIAKPISTQEPKPTQSSREYASINVLALDRLQKSGATVYHCTRIFCNIHFIGMVHWIFLVFDDSSVEMREACAKNKHGDYPVELTRHKDTLGAKIA